MSARRHLVSRTHRNGSEAVETPSRRGAQRPPSPTPTATPFPPYEPPTFPLNIIYQEKLTLLHTEHDYTKYKKHLGIAIVNMADCAAESTDRLFMQQQRLRKLVEKREAQDAQLQQAENGEAELTEKTEPELEAEARVPVLEKKVKTATAEAEKALRELIDFRDELAMQEEIMRSVRDKAEATAREAARKIMHKNEVRERKAMRGTKRRRGGEEEVDEDEEQEEEDDDDDDDDDDQGDNDDIPKFTGPTPVEVLQKEKEDYKVSYNSKSMRQRYGTNNDYINFKRSIHLAQNGAREDIPVPHASTWFPSDTHSTSQNANSAAAAARRRIVAPTGSNSDSEIENIEIDDASDDDIQFAGAIASLKCPLTLQMFREPYSNHICPHTFEKSAILAYHTENAVAFHEPGGGRRARGAPPASRKVKCPNTGCEAMLGLDDFYGDMLVARKVKKAMDEEEERLQQEELGDDEEEGEGGEEEDDNEELEEIIV